MGPTKPSENLFFRGLWGWATDTWERLQSKGGRLWSALWAFDGTVWRRQPIIWGYTQSAGENLAEASGGAAAEYLTFTEVPAGFVRHVDLVVGYDLSNVFTYFRVEFYDGAAWRHITHDAPCGAATPYGIYQPITLGVGQNLRLRFQGTTNLDSLRGVLIGYEMDLTQ